MSNSVELCQIEYLPITLMFYIIKIKILKLKKANQIVLGKAQRYFQKIQIPTTLTTILILLEWF